MLVILEEAVSAGASDVHLVPGRQAFLRVDGELRRFGARKFEPGDVEKMIFSMLSRQLVDRFLKDDELDTSVAQGELGRFRINVLRQRDGTAAVLRVIPAEIPEPEEIGLREQIVRLTDLPRGLVLVTGPTGSGKSTTLASLANVINRTKPLHILTLEDPIEYVFPTARCVITQREIGNHSHSFKESLRRAMRQDPDVILVGEMRDLETISSALTLAETGHLVFATLHTTDAVQTIDRVIDVFPPFQQQQVRTQLSSVLRAVICQQLLPRADGQGRVAAREVMNVTPAIANLIREGKTHQIDSAIELGMGAGMRSLNAALIELANAGIINQATAIAKASDPRAVQAKLAEKDRL
jgi:twitching motility protein PilT